jgi:DNA modification methylase
MVMCATSHLPLVMDALRTDARIKYHWSLIVMTPGAAPMLEWKHVSSHYKHVLWFTKGYYRGDWQTDVLRTEPVESPPYKTDKREYHEWEQPVIVFTEIIKRFTDPGQTVADFFLGSGTTALAAVSQGRRFIGCDIDAGCVEDAVERVRELLDKDELGGSEVDEMSADG